MSFGNNPDYVFDTAAYIYLKHIWKGFNAPIMQFGNNPDCVGDIVAYMDV